MTDSDEIKKIAEQLAKKPILLSIGLMSGTSMDGIDVALLKTEGVSTAELLATREYSYEAAFRTRLAKSLELAKSVGKDRKLPAALVELESEITLRHAKAVKQFLADTNLASLKIDVIGFHGQTVLHRPDKGFTVQLGDGQLLADKTGIACIYDIRANDMAYGGQGAPLVPVFHQALAAGLDEPYKSKLPIAFVNIGGISNISYIGTNGELIAFDTGPGNALIDQWVQTEGGIPFDQGGAIAAEGGVIQQIAQTYLAESFFEQTIPKSLDRNDFKPPASGSASLEDGARTLAHISAVAIIKACDHLPEAPKLWIICGGGRKNPAIMDDLKKLASKENGAKVVPAEEVGLNGDSMEAEAWAYLAVLSLKKLPLTFPMTTGCKVPVSGGKLALPKSK